MRDQLIFLIARQLRNRSLCREQYDLIEYCGGQAAITRASLALSLKAVVFDLIYSRSHNMCKPSGLRLWLDQLSLSKIGSCQWFGTTCSSWVAICEAVSKRRVSQEYFGDLQRKFVRVGNTQMAITALLIFIGFVVGSIPVLEQPSSSVMPRTPPMRTVLGWIKARRIFTWHGAFGGGTPKPLQLWTPHRGFKKLKRKNQRRRNGQ